MNKASLKRSFFKQPTQTVARQLIGKYLIVKKTGQTKIGKIIETEAYLGPQDKASHARFGQTKRSKIMWAKPGTLYVYMIYGMYYCLNIVTEPAKKPGAVLIRSLKSISGIKNSVNGPGKLCHELKINCNDNNLDLIQNKEIDIKDTDCQYNVKALPRIGVNYAGIWAKKKLRFSL